MAKRPALFETSLEKIQVGRFGILTTASEDTTLFDALMMIEKTHYSAIPIVDSKGGLVDTLYKSDLSRIPPDELLSSACAPVAKALADWRQKGILRKFGPNSCTMEDTMETVLTRLMDSHLRSLVVINNNNEIRGIVALTDILKCFLV